MKTVVLALTCLAVGASAEAATSHKPVYTHHAQTMLRAKRCNEDEVKFIPARRPNKNVHVDDTRMGVLCANREDVRKAR